ncbi:MAG: hypothetical protein D6761_08980 [Candidatus Dadabacteria bacterium]|nr:MAG: hypothetical protein D6761_08980 [Candidatus Dadabacteria bacterium]
MQRGRFATGWIALLACLIPASADAHMALQSGPFYAAVVHPWINVSSALLLVAVCLWQAQSVHRGDVLAVLAISVPLVVGALLGVRWGGFAPEAVSYGLTIVTGAVVAARLQPRAPIRLVVVALMALYGGVVAGSDAAADVGRFLPFATGTLVGALVVPAVIIGMLMERPQQVVQVGIRVVGSWICAAGIMLFVFALKAAA